MLIACVVFAWYRDRSRLEAEIYQLRSAKERWSSSQVLGPPDTQMMADVGTAWASATQDGQKEWLFVDFGAGIQAKNLHIHETFNPGAVVRVTTFSATGKETELWSGVDPQQMQSGVAIAVIPLTGVVSRVKIYIDSPSVAGWNEIDAVGIEDVNQQMHWAVRAKASSSYSSGAASANFWSF